MILSSGNYDAVFVRNIDNSIPPKEFEKDSELAMPLMLTSQDSIGYSRVLASPVSNVSEGSPRDSSLGTWISYSQETWDKGILEESAPDTSLRSYFSLADTRYAKRATLPPKVFGPFEISDVVSSGGPYTVGTNESVTTRWVINLERMFILIGGKLFMSVLDETAIANGIVIPNWKHCQTGLGTAGATDIEAMLISSAWKILTSTPTGIAQNDPVTGAYLSTSGGFSKKLFVAGDTTLSQVISNKFVSGTSIGTPAELVTGDTSLVVNSVVALGNSLLAITNRGIYTTSPVKRVVSFGEYAANESGSVACSWQGKLYVALADTLQSWDGQTVNMASVGLDREASIPKDIAKTIVWLAPSDTTLYAATYEQGKQSAIFSMTEEGVWHCLFIAPLSKKISSLALDNRSGRVSGGTDSIINTQVRLWFAIGNHSYYMYVGRNESVSFPSPYGSVQRGFAPYGEIKSSLWTGKYTAVNKIFQGGTIVLESEVKDAQVYLDVETDRSGVWVPMKSIKQGQRLEFITTTPTWGSANVISADLSTLFVDNINIKVGDHIRVGKYNRQVVVSDNGIISLNEKLPVAIPVGTVVYPMRPNGYELRTRIRMITSDSSVTPVIKRITISFAHQVLTRARHVIHAIVADGMSDKIGGAYPYKAKEISEAILSWAKRSPFWFIGPEGASLCKIINVSQARYSWPDQKRKDRYPISIATITLVEVEDAIP